MFKHIFTNNPDILKKFLIDVLKLDINPNLATIIIENNELTKSREKEYQKNVDIYVSINNNLRIDIEVNSEKFSSIKARNVLYLNKIAIDTTESGFTYQKMNKQYFYQLNLNAHKSDKYLDEEYLLVSTNKHQILLDNYKIICKSLDYYKELYYNQGKNSSKDVIWLSLLGANNFNELEEMASLVMDEKEKNKFVSECKDSSKNTKWLSEWGSEYFAEMVKQNVIEDAKEEGLKEGQRKGLQEGLKKGINQKQTEMVKKLLEQKVSYEIIATAASISVNDVKRIEKSM